MPCSVVQCLPLAAALTLGLGLGLAFAACRSGSGGSGAPASNRPLAVRPLLASGDLAGRFAGFHEPVTTKVTPKVPATALPLSEREVQNLADVREKLPAPDAVWQRLLASGVVTTSFGAQDDVVAFYDDLEKREVPLFITSDSVLHLYHVQFDETLREVEEREFAPRMAALTRAFQSEMLRRRAASSGREQDAYTKGLAFFTVALKLFDPAAPVPAAVRETVEWELKRIDEHEGFPDFAEASRHAVLAYPEDYSQYVPRGHYTRSEALQRYFKAMTWYGRLTLLLRGHENHGPDASQPALVSVAEAETQTILAATIAALLGELRADGHSCAEIWTRVYSVTAYYVGLADDLTPDDYLKALKASVGNTFSPGDLARPGTLSRFQSELARLGGPAIYGGTGASEVNVELDPGRTLSPAQLEKLLGKTQGFRLMGQRYIPDSYVLGQLVAPVIGTTSRTDTFTGVYVPGAGIIRGFPRGLDVMAVLGSERALAVLEKLGDTDYAGYDERLAELRARFGAISGKDWNRNLYWSWLHALKALITPAEGTGWPTFMTTVAWQDKQLNAALGSWASLRHDTILYAKQSYTPAITTSVGPEPPPPGPVVGYVEPVPEFYARLVAMTRMSIRGLGAMKVLNGASRRRLEALEAILARLQRLAEQELANQELARADHDFIRDFGENLAAVVAGAEATAQKTTLVADVHTDQNSGQVLEEATGALRLLLVAYRLPAGHVLVGAGPAFSYYELRHPMADRLTDEKWRKLLAGPDAPSLPDWTRSFAEF